MNNSDTLGVESLTMTPKQSKANKVKRAKQKGKVKGRPIPAPVVEEDVAPRYPLRSFSSSDPTVEATCSQNPSPVPSYTPLNIPPLGTTAGTIAERYLPPHLRNFALRPAASQGPRNVKATRDHSTRSAKSPKPAQAPETPKTASTRKTSKSEQKHSSRTRPLPSPTPAYLSQASQPPTRLPEPQKLLIILDLNGTLIHRKGKSLRSFTPRPYLASFLEYCFKEHIVMVWSSARPENVGLMCDYLFTPEQRQMLVAEWGRNTLGLTSTEYNEKVQVYKRLNAVWDNEAVQKLSCPGYSIGRRWGPANTILVDDGLEKGSSEPWNLVEVPEFAGLKGGKDERGDVDDLAEVLCWIEEARWWSNVSGFSGAMGMRFEVGKDWGQWARNMSGGVLGKGVGRVVAGVETPEVDDTDGESSVGDSDSDGGVRLPLS